MNNKVTRKYEPLIFVLLVLAYLLRYAYSIYLNFASIQDASTTTYVLNVFYTIFEEGLVPALIAFFIPSIIYSIGFRRYVRYIPRTDFVAYSMIITAIIEAVIGVFGVFSIIVEDMISYITVFEPTLFAISYLLFYFLYVAKKYNFNPVERYNAFKIWFMCLVVLQGLEVIIGEGLILYLSTRTELLAQLGSDYAYYFALSDIEKIMGIVEISLYVAFVVVYIVLNYSLKAKCDGYQNPETREEYTIRMEENPFKEHNNNNKKDNDDHDDINDIFGI